MRKLECADCGCMFMIKMLSYGCWDEVHAETFKKICPLCGSDLVVEEVNNECNYGRDSL
jgi:rRNA maturation endonuclease Nob1